MKMQRQAEAKPGSSREEPGRQVQRDSVEVRAAKLVEPDVGQAHQGQRGQKMLAELAVSHPGLPFLIPLERERIDEDRPPLVKLHVERAAILQRHPVVKRKPLDLQGQQGRVLVLAEAPLVRIRDQLNPVRPDHLVGVFELPGSASISSWGIRRPALGQLAIQPRAHQLIIVQPCQLVDLAKKTALILVDEAPRVAERCCRSLVRDHARPWFLNTVSFSFRYEDLAQKRPLSNPAMRIWKSMLPEPGSR